MVQSSRALWLWLEPIMVQHPWKYKNNLFPPPPPVLPLFSFLIGNSIFFFFNHRNYIFRTRIMKASQLQVRYTVINIHITFLNARRLGQSSRIIQPSVRTLPILPIYCTWTHVILEQILSLNSVTCIHLEYLLLVNLWSFLWRRESLFGFPQVSHNVFF